jgi:hypothetical protein
VVRGWTNPPPCHQEPTWTVDRGLSEPSDHFRNSGFISLECREKSLVMQIPRSRKGFLGVEFGNLVIRGSTYQKF